MSLEGGGDRVGRNRVFSQNISLQPAKTAKTQFFSNDY